MSENVASSSAEEHVDLQRLQAWLESQLGRSGTITAERMGQGVGVANALFDVRFGNDRYVLRRPPTVKVTASAGQTMREAWVLRSLAGTDVPHPRLIAACGDASVIGTPFTLMECVDGFTADLKYPPENNRVWSNLRVGAPLRIAGEDYNIVAITKSEVVLYHKLTQKKTSRPFNPAP